MEEIKKTEKSFFEVIDLFMSTLGDRFPHIDFKHDSLIDIIRKSAIGLVQFIGYLVSGVLGILGIAYTFKFLHTNWTPENATYFGLVGVIITLAIGYGLYRFKKANQTLYGLIEIGASCAYCFYTFTTLVKNTPSFFGMSISVISMLYFSQRGFNNFHDGRKSKSRP